MTIPEPLADGYRRFRRQDYRRQAERYRALAGGQAPQVMVIACSDSRVDPATIFSARPGELFVVRNVANLVPPCEESGTYHGTSAALEFAVEFLRVKHIVVLGHGGCGGISACLEAGRKRPVGRFIAPWVEIAAPARDEVLQDHGAENHEVRQHALELAAIRHSLDNLAGFPFIAKALGEGRLGLHGAWFAIHHGELHWLDAGTGEFVPVEAAST